MVLSFVTLCGDFVSNDGSHVYGIRKKRDADETSNENVNVIIDYFNTNNYTKEAALKFYEYYKVNNFKDSNNKVVKNWKQKARWICFKPENEIKDLTKTKMVY